MATVSHFAFWQVKMESGNVSWSRATHSKHLIVFIYFPKQQAIMSIFLVRLYVWQLTSIIISTSASLLDGWSVTVVSKTAKGIGISWSSPVSLLSGGVCFYVAFATKINSSSGPIGEILAENITTSEIENLNEYTEYKVIVVAVDGDGMPFKSADVLVMTDEGGE